jgi:hypothetical protein
MEAILFLLCSSTWGWVMERRRVWIVSLWAAACVSMAGCGREDLAQPARDHRSVDEAAAGPVEAAVVEAQRTARAPSRTAARGPEGRPVWADSRRYSAEENASYQFDQHGDELAARDLDDFVAKAHRFVNDPPAGAKTLVRANGDRLLYDPDSGLFGVARRDGAPRTVFKPDDGDAYWAEQVRENETGGRTAQRRAASDAEG